jgi:hypothetical protein
VLCWPAGPCRTAKTGEFTRGFDEFFAVYPSLPAAEARYVLTSWALQDFEDWRVRLQQVSVPD